MPAELGIVWALMFGIPAGLLGLLTVSPALVLAQPGDSVTITVLDVGIQESTRTMQSFRDTRVQLRPAGS